MAGLAEDESGRGGDYPIQQIEDEEGLEVLLKKKMKTTCFAKLLLV